MGRQYRQFKTIQIMARILPRRTVYWLGDRLADVYFTRDERSRNAVSGNIRRILAFKGSLPSDLELEDMTRQVFRGLGRNFIDLFRYNRLSDRAIQRLFSVSGFQNLGNAHRMGKGVLVLSAHYGCFEMGTIVVRSHGLPVSLVMRPWEEPRADALFVRQRMRRGVNVIQVGNAARGSLEALRRGDVLAVLGDFDFTHRDDRMRFLDGEVRLPLGPARLSLKTGAPIVPFFVTRRPDQGYAVRFDEPILPSAGSTLESIQARIVRILEAAVLENPHFWLLFSDVWDCEMSMRIAKQGFAVFGSPLEKDAISAG
jgi:Kdo2-lipid IVA lauroyltransferase/acyltransferase